MIKLLVKRSAKVWACSRGLVLTVLLLFNGGGVQGQLKVVHPLPQGLNNTIVAYEPSDKVRLTENVVYCDTLTLDIYRPENAAGSPSLVLIHGGGWASGDKQQLAQMAVSLAERGYVCFVPQYRLSGQAKYPAAVQDVQAVVDWLGNNAEAYGAQPQHIIPIGFSAGGQLAALVATTFHTPRYRNAHCAFERRGNITGFVDIDGILAFIHPDSGEGDDTKRLSAATRWFGSPKSEGTLLWEEASPLRHVSAKTPPSLFLNSNIKRMQAGRDDFTQVLDSHGIYYEVHEFTAAPHDFCLRTPWFTEVIVRIDAFVRKL